MDSVRYPRSKTVFALVAQRPIAFFLLLLWFVLLPVLPVAWFLVALFWTLPLLYLVFASAYFAEDVVGIVSRAKSRMVPYLQSMGLHGLVLGVMFASIWWLSGKQFPALLYPFAGPSALANSWFRFCDKFPIEPVLLLGGFWFFWPSVWSVLRKDRGSESSSTILDSNEALFTHLLGGPWPYLLLAVCMLGFGWYWLLPKVFSYWASSLLIAGCVMLMLFLAGWSFLYGVQLSENHEEDIC
ncbi:hypothetical protein [Acidithiobacillus caldus]|uniref:Uncharacterized protein n=1 Tax=Acidithiobacillus caldus TaxID=33059 RepID=A0A1E7YUU0_9PROT|nr:hypothetical protein [Acidithiobacillus caldus]OFC35995.1 hypothetical protein BAE27_06795 [Acidithiobacillus caldus]OFC38357.1 hypothetical protein BAE28_05765 [Acidithiobacillus caldus]OFC40385.1 hypothetical protein BAE29_05380 [Acidithiobacillus caldus]OFC58621.1 hypothetical protein BAE30_08970 [Acidithiobacillus caldus]